jgi:hypothetical protein
LVICFRSWDATVQFDVAQRAQYYSNAISTSSGTYRWIVMDLELVCRGGHSFGICNGNHFSAAVFAEIHPISSGAIFFNYRVSLTF